MPLIQRIEISNFLNSTRANPWRPDWPHQVFEINGENAVLNIPNGKGKSTMSKAILSMLGGHGKSLREIASNFFAPARAGHYTHIRIQVLIPLPGSGGGDLVTAAGGEAGGLPMVFGMYGNSGENEKPELYGYQGTLEDCPVATVHNLHHTLVADDAFLGQLKVCQGAFPSNAKERTMRAWQAYVEDFFDVASVRQQLLYQLQGGGEGGSGYFSVVPPLGMNYSAAVFYERLAPELLSEVMGDLGEEGERGIEDTIHEKVSKVISAKHETARKAEELRRAGNTLREIEALDAAASRLNAAQQDYNAHLGDFSLEFAVLRDALIDRPIPGVPSAPPESIPEIAKSMAMQDGKWFLPDRAMAEFTDEPASTVNRRALDRNGLSLEQASRSQVIDFPCHSFSSLGKRGPSGSLYSRDSALGLIRITSNFARGWSRETALEALEQAFGWAEAHGDTNPSRALLKKLDGELSAKQKERDRLSGVYRDHQKEKEALLTEQSQVGEAQAEYRRMAESGLFSEEELADPAKAGEAANANARKASEALDAHKSRAIRLSGAHESWRAFVLEHGESARPAEFADRLEGDKAAAEAGLREADKTLAEARGRRSGLAAAKSQAAAGERKAKERLRRYAETAPAAARFALEFGEVSAEGMASKVGKERDEARKSLEGLRIERGRLADALEALGKFRAAHGAGASPSGWLEAQSREWDRLGAEIVGLEASLGDAKIRRASLEQAPIAPGRVTREAAKAAGGNHRPLHAAVDAFALGGDRREKALTLFSALLHAPVYETAEEAMEAAARLEKAGVEAPVFARAELERFCQTGEISMLGAGAKSWLVGIRTRQVDCLLDPSLAQREKDLEDGRIRSLGEAIQAAKIQRGEASPESAMAAIARKAREAIAGGFEAKDAALGLRQKELEERLPALELRSGPEMIQVIQGAERHQKEFAGIAEDSLREELAACEQAEAEASKAYDDNEDAIGGIEREQSQKSALARSASEAALQAPRLRQLQAYIDHPEDNPAFMERAEEIQKGLEEAQRSADLRARFRFGAADAFVKKGASRPKEIEERLQEIKFEMEGIQDRLLPALSSRIEAIQEERLDRAKEAGEIDEFVRGLLRGYREYASEQDVLLPASREKIESRPLGAAALGLREAESLADQARMLLDIKDDAQYEDASSLRSAMREARGKHEGAKADLGNLIDRALAAGDLDMTEHVRLELARAKERPEIIAKLHSAALFNYEKNQAANNVAREHLDAEWGNIAKWLKGFTQRLPDNLATMKRVFGPGKDESGRKASAGFEIEATLADQSDIQAVLDEVVSLVEKHETLARETDGATAGLREMAKKGIRGEIRNTFYRKVISSPRIKVYMPSISASALPLEKNMVSTGQGIAMTLLWIVKMADYVTERELRRVTTSSAQRRRLQPTQFALIDGAFSSLSNKGLIKDALDSIKRTRGRFQLIITGHDENYQNNFEYFPTLITAREINGQFMYADAQTRRVLQPEEVGSHYGAMGTMSLRIRPKPDVGEEAAA